MKNKILFGVSLLFGLMYINSVLNKFFNYMPMPKDMPESMMKLFGAFMTIGWLFPLIAVAEIVGGILFWYNDAKYFYYTHGPLARVEYGDNHVQGVDYYYTIQGVIKGVNSNIIAFFKSNGNK